MDEHQGRRPRRRGPLARKKRAVHPVRRARTAALLMLVLANGAAAPPGPPGTVAGTPSLDLRVRYEHAVQDGRRDAGALTSRLRLGYGAPVLPALSAFAEFEGVAAAGGDGSYDSGPGFLEAGNGNRAYAVIPDPPGEELNRAWLRYTGLAGTTVTVGRQRIIHGNARFVGNVGWRQNEQTFDAARISSRVLTDITLDYAYVWRQNFVLFNANRLDTHLLNAHWAPADAFALSAFAHDVRFDDSGGRRVPGAPDHRVLGLHASGVLGDFGYALGAAVQDVREADGAGADARYLLAELRYAGLPVDAAIGIERLGGDGAHAIRFPLATNHKFSGWADVFIVTPADGLVDRYLRLSAALAGFDMKLVLHDFVADRGAGAYGRELDASLGRKLREGLSVLAKFAAYRADTFGGDLRRLWLQFDYRF